jgi:AraC family transcriptional regulator, regulatory protein of adaptative response / DNA-3-methyladenine glycosylase II
LPAASFVVFDTLILLWSTLPSLGRPAPRELIARRVRIRQVFERPDRYTFGVESFSGVVTTGIYCRPGCGGRPHAHNVTKYPLAASAEAAGFRACFQCRPYRWPQSVSWTGPELVCRAVRLILDGALDGATEAQLGVRLGVSPRHLRRLFISHLGVTPDGLARSARAHFARRLLDDTDLSVLEISLAAGFGSVRQLNRACREIFRASPRALRAKRRKADRLVADGGLPVRLAFRGQLDWDAMTAYFAARAIPGVEHVDGDVYRRTIVVDGDPGVTEIYPGGSDHLVLVLHLPHWEELTHIVARARRIASLDVDLDEPAQQLSGDPVIGPLLRARPGLRTPGTWDPFETGVRAIVGQQVSVAAATTVAGRLVAHAGTPVPGLAQLGLTHAFPSAETLADADLEGLGLTRARQQAIRGFARGYAEDAIRLDGSVGLDCLVDSITAIDGLGSWTAQYLALRIGERDAFPATDLGLRRAVGQVELALLAERWRPWRALAATHLWMQDGAPARPRVAEPAAA